MSIWQTENWKKLLLKSNQASNVFEVDWVFAEKRSLGLWVFWLFILWPTKKIDKQKLIDLSKTENCLFVQIETYSLNEKLDLSFTEIDTEMSNKNKTDFEKWYYKKFITPYTAIIDLSQNKDEILANMKPKWRYNIKLAKKKWVEVFEAKKTSENIDIFHKLMLETTSRDGFNWNTIEYYKDFLELIPGSSLIFTKYEDTILSAWIFIFDKEISIYYYWASTSDKKYRNLMAPYLMQWFAISKTKEIKSKYYDFLWIATPWEKDSPLAWVTDFKMKLSQNTVNCSESYIFINNKIKYKMSCLLKKIKAKI